MKVHVDADACPVKELVIKIGKSKGFEVVLYMDVNHVYRGNDVEVVTVDQGPDSVDMAIVNGMGTGEVVITNDYGLAALVIGKGGIVMDGKGKEYTSDNIDLYLFERHMHKEIRMAKKRHKGPKKRLKEADLAFAKNFEALLVRVKRQ